MLKKNTRKKRKSLLSKQKSLNNKPISRTTNTDKTIEAMKVKVAIKAATKLEVAIEEEAIRVIMVAVATTKAMAKEAMVIIGITVKRATVNRTKHMRAKVNISQEDPTEEAEGVEETEVQEEAIEVAIIKMNLDNKRDKCNINLSIDPRLPKLSR